MRLCSDVIPIALPDLAEVIRAKTPPEGRFLVALAGPPGAGPGGKVAWKEGTLVKSCTTSTKTLR